MKILLLSDTHYYFEKRLLPYIETVDEIWHAGDIGNEEVLHTLQSLKPVRAVYGNIDGHLLRAQLTENLFFEVEGVKVYMTHIGGYPRKYSLAALTNARSYQPKLFICGHSHILRVMYDQDNQWLVMNSGAAGLQGIHQYQTALRFDIEKGTIKNLEVIELPKGPL